MSCKELQKYLAGSTLTNTTAHWENHKGCTSVGFCWAEITPARDENKWLRKLIGIADAQFALVIDTDTSQQIFTESRAWYAGDTLQPDGTMGRPILVREWCCMEYDRRRVPELKVGICPSLVEVIHGTPLAVRWTDDIDNVINKTY